MSKNYLSLLTLLIFSFCLNAQNKESHIIYNAKGKKVSYAKMLKDLEARDVILFGELHNNPISHWLQLELTKDLSKEKKLVLGAEMYEADNQNELDDYLAGEINYKALDTLARLWSNDKTDYAPLLDFAKDNQLKFIATNIPRRFANNVYRGGFSVLDTLSDEQKSWIAPLPVLFEPELPRYVNILKMMGDHGTPELVMAQAIKDATMAHFILQNHHDGDLFLHYNGAYHSDFHEGIFWYLLQEKSTLNAATISTVSQESVDKLDAEYFGQADYIICVDEDMTTTY